MIDDNDTEADKGEDAEGEQPAAEGKHHLKEEMREKVAKAWGLAVEAGSVLAGQGGDIVQAERTVAEDRAEDLIDKIDGEG